MAGISPIPSTRISDLFVRQRLLNQLTSDQAALVRVQTQITTGRRFVLPSDDAPAALRGISLQQLLERKQQVRVNLTTNQSYLSATDSALSRVSGILSEIRGTALGVIGDTANTAQRQAAAQEVDRAVQQLVDTGNQRFRGRYLFAGSRTTVQPFTATGTHVRYNGNESSLSSYSDIDVLFSSNADGNTVFGAISEPVQGSVDLNPVLSATTRLADLRGGQGISDGSISVSDGALTSIVDLSGAETVGDVVALIEANPPGLAEGTPRAVTVSIGATGLTVTIDSPDGLILDDVGGGTTASELGLMKQTLAGTTHVGDDLNPLVTRTTPLDDVLGVSASATIASASANNDLRIFARSHGTALNGVTISFVDNPAVTAGNETVAYDDTNPANKTLTFQIDAGNTTAADIVDLLASDPLFQAELAASDSASEADAGTGVIDVTAGGVTADGIGADFDTSGILISSGDETHAISFANADSIEDVLNLINGAEAGLLAEINEAGTGINVRTRLSGVDFAIGENGGATAAQLGLRTFTAQTRLEDLNHGFGVHSIDESGFENRRFTIRRTNGTLMEIDLAGAETIQDVLDLINGHVNNGGAVVARLATSGNGIELETSEAGAESFAVLRTAYSQAAEDLGLIAPGGDQSDPAAVAGATQTLTGRDANPQEVSGMFTALVRLRDALRTDDLPGIQRAVELLDGANLQVNLVRAEVGARQQGLDVLQARLDDEVISLEDTLSKEIDADVPEAISTLAARQAAFEASLRTTAAISQLTLLDFL